MIYCMPMHFPVSFEYVSLHMVTYLYSPKPILLNNILFSFGKNNIYAKNIPGLYLTE